ncbi:RNA-binding transcriptional accessory protein, partial [bacterium]|nr:RNA-binding transcriptional accessory protein [candidate division CSSED10-310 bacterium]
MSLDDVIVNRLAVEYPTAARGCLQNLLQLQEEGATVPFIARYRKERTGNMDEVMIRDVLARYDDLKQLQARKERVLERVGELGKLDEELRVRIVTCFDKQELEDMYLPFRPKRRTKAEAAREKGLEPLAARIFAQDGSLNLTVEAQRYVAPDKDVAQPEDALEGAGHIIAEWMAESAECRGFLRELVTAEGAIRSDVLKDKAEMTSKFEDYYEFVEKIHKIPGHRYLAVRRGAKEGFLRLSLDYPEERALNL